MWPLCRQSAGTIGRRTLLIEQGKHHVVALPDCQPLVGHALLSSSCVPGRLSTYFRWAGSQLTMPERF